jgi:MFS family permease
MSAFTRLLRTNPNYRHVWLGQVVSEIGDYFNNIAVFSLVMETTGSGLAISAVMLARAVPAVLAGPVAGVMLDRFDRKRMMIASDLLRAVVALGFILTVHQPRLWLVLGLSALLMFASPFFTGGRTAILPMVCGRDEIHTANSLTQTTQWATQTVGTLLAGISAAVLGYSWAFVLNSASFLFSAAAIRRLRGASFRADRAGAAAGVLRPWQDYREGLSYIRSSPLTFAITALTFGWAIGGGAAQVLFTLFGEQVFHRGAAGIGSVWGFAGLGLLAGGALGHAAGRRVGFRGYKRAVSLSYLLHGATYVLFSLAGRYWEALLMVMVSRIGMAIASVLNQSQLLLHTPDEYRGRVFSTIESVRWAVMMVSMALAGAASQVYSPRLIGVAAGGFAVLTAATWAIADWRGHLPEPREPSERARPAPVPAQPGTTAM